MKKIMMLFIVAVLLCSGSVLAVDVDFSLEGELWLPQVKMESYNRYRADDRDWDPAKQVFDGSIISADTTLNMDFPNKWGGRVLFNYAAVNTMDYPEHRFGEGPDCDCELNISPSGTLDFLGADILYTFNEWGSVSFGYRNYLLLLGGEGEHLDDSRYRVELGDPFLKEYGIRAEGLRLGAKFTVPFKDKYTFESNLGFCPYLVGKEAARWHCEHHGEQYLEVLSKKRDQKAVDLDLKVMYAYKPNLDLYLGYKYMNLYVNQLHGVEEETSWDDGLYRKWYDSHNTVLSGLTLGAVYKF